MGINNQLPENLNQTASSRLNLELFRDIFEKNESGLVISSFEEAHGSGRGDNYTATLFRILLKGHIVQVMNNDGEKNNGNGKKLKWEKSVICKRLPDNRARREAYKSEQLFRNEVEFYTTIISELIKFQQTKFKEILFNAIPKCYLAQNDLIILEDLRVRKFIMPNRQKGLNFMEIEAVLIELAKYHSLSLAYKAQYPHEFVKLKDCINEGIFKTSNTEWFHNYYKRLTKNAIDMVTETLSINSHYVQHLKEFLEENTESFFSRMVELINRETSLSVICHGDCWTNNFLYRYNMDGKILETCLVDFQLIRYGSLALDLANLIFCCTDHQLRKKNMKQFLKIYYKELLNALKLYGPLSDFCGGLNDEQLWNKLQAEFRIYGKFGLGLAIDILPISTCSSEEAPDLYMNLSDEIKCEAPQLDVPPNDMCRQKMTDIVIDLVDNDML